jgi:hypothetical protein
MYLPGKILYVGGGRTTNTAEIINLNDPAPAWHWTGSMAFARRHLNATVLPTGDVLVTGGVGGTTANDLTQGVHAAELWSPDSNSWTTLAANQITRGYHATALLLPDGRVLHAGSGDAANGPPEFNAELFSPPYLLQGARPVISSAPKSVPYDGSITLETPDPAAITRVSLIHLGSTTHAFDMDQRFEWLSFTRTTGALSVAVPTDRNVTPPGYYMIFVLDGNNIPSVGRILQIGGSSDPGPGPSGTITLGGKTRSNTTTQFMDLTWSGAKSATVDLYRNGNFRKNTPNDGKETDSRAFTQAATYIFKICESGTYICSNPATLKFLGGAATTNKAPIAAFTNSCTDLNCGFTDGSVDLDGSLTAWSWNFGDGSSSTLPSPSHAYSSGGTYTVALTVTDNRNAKKTLSQPLTVAGP